MKQSFTFKTSQIINYLNQQHGLKNLNLYTIDDYVDLMNNFIVLMKLDTIIAVKNVNVIEKNMKVLLELKESKTTDDFKDSIHKIQAELKEEPVIQKEVSIPTTIQIIEAIESELMVGLYSHKCIGTTSKNEEDIILRYNRPDTFIYIDTYANETAKKVFNHFIRNGYKSVDESEGKYIFAFNKY